ncbi:Uncharacterised protein [Bordetella pertussis]|nr:Uncharacterised protein [Bordetella pertussis]
MLPVVSTSRPVLLDSAISKVPRARAWMFSSVASTGRPANCGASAASKRSTTSPMAITSYCTPRRRAMSAASVREMSAV